MIILIIDLNEIQLSCVFFSLLPRLPAPISPETNVSYRRPGSLSCCIKNPWRTPGEQSGLSPFSRTSLVDRSSVDEVYAVRDPHERLS